MTTTERERIEQFAHEVFASHNKADAWLDSPWDEHEGIPRRQMLDTPDGRKQIERALIQIDEGIYG